MKILIVSERFSPSIGGVQTVTRLLGEALARAGQEVLIATHEAGTEANGRGFRLLRRPGMVELLRRYTSADAIILQGLTLGLGWPLLLQKRACLAVHHNEPAADETRPGRWLRAALARRVRHAAVSKALARKLPWRTDLVVNNPYEAGVFQNDKSIVRTREILFVGRLVPEKGVPVLLTALAILRREGHPVDATIAGDGPEKERLAEMVRVMELEQCVLFAGQVCNRVVSQLMKRHRLLVVPSVYPESFGLVALEAIASGCAVIASQAGGLPEATGPCGTMFATGDARALARKIRETLSSCETINRFQACAKEHLARHHPDFVAGRYLELLSSLRTKGSG